MLKWLRWLKNYLTETHKYVPGSTIQVVTLQGWRRALYLREGTPKHWHLVKYGGATHLVHLEDMRP